MVSSHEDPVRYPHGQKDLGAGGPTAGARALYGKWVLDQKFTPEGEWTRNRARWVVCGNGEKRDSTADLYSAVIHLTTLRVILVIAHHKSISWC